MDNQQSQLPQQQPTMNAHPAPSHRKSHAMLMGLGAIVFFGLGMLAGYMLGGNKQIYAPNKLQVAQVSPTEIAENTPIPTNNIPADWSMQTSVACNVDFPVPPKTAPYYIPDKPNKSADLIDDNGYFWIMENTQNTEDKLLPNVSLVTYRNPNTGGSGYIAGLVLVNCGTNYNNYTSQQFVDVYVKRFSKYPDSAIRVTKKETINLWGNSVFAITIEGGMSNPKEPTYILATDKHLYVVQKTSMSQNNQVKETTATIFNNLVFKD